MTPSTQAIFFTLWILFVLGIVIVTGRRKAAAAKLVAESAGLSDLRFPALGNPTGRWQGHRVTFRFRGGGRNGPEMAVVEIAAAVPTRVAIRKQMRFTFGLVLIGPPAIQTALDSELAVRADDSMLAQRLLGDAQILTVLRQVILERLDELDLRTKRVRVSRQTRAAGRVEALRAAWQLASTVVERLGLPPGG